MSKPDDIPPDVWGKALSVRMYAVYNTGDDVVEAIARAILNERNNAAKIAEDIGEDSGDPDSDFWDGHKHAAGRISQAIRNGGK
jgi:hypothetical protein